MSEKEQNRNVDSNDATPPDYKLLIDPQIRKGEEKLVRYTGETYNTENHGQGVVIIRDPRPRMNRLWSRREICDLPVPRYKVDEWYIGAVPPREITFSKLNDNITKQFMEKMCSKFGKLERVRVYYHPKNQKHMGLSKVVFSSMKSAAECVKQLHNTSVMGNVIHAQIDSKGELLNKLFQRIARGEMVAETVPDVIRHTQDGISMSNKFKERSHCRSTKEGRRRSSQDDPRKLRKSIDESDKHASRRQHRKDSIKEVDDINGNSTLLVNREDKAPDAYESTDNETRKKFTSSDRDDSQSEVEHQPVDLESRISSLLQEDMNLNLREPASLPERHQERLSAESTDNVIDVAPPETSTFSNEQRDSLELDRRNLPHSNSAPDLPIERYHPGDRLRYEHEGGREHSPHYRHNHHERGPDDPKMHHYHRVEYDRNREPPPGSRYYDRHGYERGYYHNCESRENDFVPRRSDHRRVYSPPRGPYRHSNHLPSRYRHPSPERFNHHRYSPPRNRTDRYGGSRTGSRSPEPWRRSPGYHPDSDARHTERRRRSHHGRSQSPPILHNREAETNQSTPWNANADSNMSLDQRLKEMTGETSSRTKRKKKDLAKEQQLDDESSVDMEISEGESNHENEVVRQQEVKCETMNPDLNPMSSHERWNAVAPSWNGHDVHARMWNNVIPQHDFRDGFDRNPQLPGQYPMTYPAETWASHFHPTVMPPGIMPPQFNFLPPDSYPMVPPMLNSETQPIDEDENLYQCVLSAIVEDLKSTVSRDLNRKVVETMAFKVYESWWDENASTSNAIKATSVGLVGDKLVTIIEKPDTPTHSQQPPVDKPDNKLKNQSLLNAFDPLNWAKNSFEMDGFRIGLGLRSAVLKMPSFRVKKRPTIPSPVKGEENEDAPLSKKARLADGKENQEQNILSSKKKRQRITVLDSEGEDDRSDDEDSYADSASDDDTKAKSSVLKVEEVFSDSAESSDDLSSEESERSSEEESSESESEDEAAPPVNDLPKVDDEEAVSTPADEQPVDLPVEDKQEQPEKTEETKAEAKSISDLTSESRASTESDTTNTVEDSTNISSLLSPSAQGVSPCAITPQQLRHVHPKKRHRLISHEQYEPFAKIPATDHDKLKEDLSLITEEERSVLEALTYMHKTPERRITTDSDASVTSLPENVPAPATKQETLHDALATSPQNELDAVQALLSFREAGSQMPVIPKKPTIQLKYKNVVTPSESALLVALAKEHNYFVQCNPRRLPSTDPVAAQVLEEHNYSRVMWEEAESDHERPPSPLSESTLSADSEIVTPAEHVKLRREKRKKLQKTKKKKKSLVAAIQFPPRNKMEDLVIAYEMWCSGLDLEDMKYIRKVYQNRLEDPSAPTWVNDSHWVPHTVTASVSPKKSKSKRRRKDRNIDDLDVHKTGSARTEGYYKLEHMVKLEQRREMYGKGDSQSATPLKMAKSISNGVPECGSSAPDKNLGARETRHFMRRIAAEVGSDVGDLFKYNQLMFRKKAVKFKRSSIHGWGLFAEEPIGADEMVIEYVGQVVRTLIAERREVNYTELGIGSSYLFRIDTEHIIDATKCGNYARFMNHSCNPSCYAKVITVDTAKKIVIYSKGPIKKSQEITYDYKFPLEDDKVMCFCGAENCRRTLN